MRYVSAYLNHLRQRLQRWHNPGKEVKQLLRQAAEYLPADVVALPDVSRVTLEEFQVYLAEDEWALAMEALEELASGARPPAPFWGLLAQAAKQMECEVQEQRYKAYSEES